MISSRPLHSLLHIQGCPINSTMNDNMTLKLEIPNLGQESYILENHVFMSSGDKMVLQREGNEVHYFVAVEAEGKAVAVALTEGEE